MVDMSDSSAVGTGDRPDVRFQGTRRRILELLKLRGPLTAAEMGKALGMTAMGVRQHLTLLERDRLIAYRTESRGMGRSSHVYSLTRVGDEVFPRTYPELANDLIETVRSLDGDEAVGRLFERRTDQLEARYQARMAGHDNEGRMRELAAIRTEEGYMAEWKRAGEESFILRENNCAILQVARGCSEVCGAELDLIRRVLGGAKVTRQAHMMRGDRTCTYLVDWGQAGPDRPA